MVVVKKYGNRRLYDTGDSRYVTLGEIAAKIRAGVSVRVVDAKTNEDLTPQLLVQILFEDRDSDRLLPLSLLVQLVRLGDDALAEFFSRYVTWAMEVYLQARQNMNALPLNPFAHAAFGAMNPLAAMFGGPGRAEPPWPPAPAAPSQADEVAALRMELDELKRTLRASGAVSGAAPRDPRKPPR